MKDQIFNLAQQVSNASYNFDEVTPYEGGYSGRGMYGRSTHGLVVPDLGIAKDLDNAMAIAEHLVEYPDDHDRPEADILEFLVECEEIPAPDSNEFKYFTFDNLGLSYIIY